MAKAPSTAALAPFVKQHKHEIELLHWRGYFPQYKSLRKVLTLIDRPTFDQAMEDFHKLTDKKSPDEIEVRFCMQPDRAPLRATLCQWPKLDVTWHTIGDLGQIGAADVKSSFNEACSWWNEICAIRLRYGSNPKTVDILARAANLGGPGNVLADSGLPCSRNPGQIPQRYDAERWVISPTPAAGQIDLTRVQCHELFHALGSDHIGAGNLGAPMYSNQIRKPQAGDIAEMQKRYPGPGSLTPPLEGDVPVPPVTPSGAKTVRITGPYNCSAAGAGQLVIVVPSGQVAIS